MNERNEDGSCSGSCDKHRISWCHPMYYLGCPLCFRIDYLDRGYTLDHHRIPKADFFPIWETEIKNG